MPPRAVQPRAKAKAEAAVKAGATAKGQGKSARRGRQVVQAAAAGQAGADGAAGAVAAPVAQFDFAQFHTDNRNQNAVNAQIYNEVLHPAINATVQDQDVSGIGTLLCLCKCNMTVQMMLVVSRHRSIWLSSS